MTAAAHTALVRDILVEISPLGLAWPNNTGALKDATGRVVRYGCVGSPDILACIRGRFVGVECKTGAGQLRAEQKRFAAATAAHEGLYIVARSVEDVTAALRLEGLA